MPQDPIQDAARVVKAVENSEIERRLTNLEGEITKLENGIEKMQNNLLDRHTKLITIIFSCITLFVAFCAILVTVLGFLSKSESHEATKEMEAKVEKATSKMEADFKMLAGQAVKKSLLQALCQSGPLDGHLFDNTANPAMIELGPIFLKNTGDKRSDTISVRLYASEDMTFINSSYWEPVVSNDQNYRHSWYLNSTRGQALVIDAGETWTVENSFQAQIYNGATNVNFRLLVFYGGENPSESEFIVKLRK